MPIYSPTGFLDITNATLRTSNVEAENLLMTGGNIYVTSELETDATVLNLENVTRKGNVSSNTIEITNVTTGIVATGNVHASKFIGSGSHLTGIPPSAITGTLSQWSDGTNGDVYIASNVGIGNVHTLTSNTLQVGGNLYVRDTGSNVLTVNGNVVANYFEGDGSKLSGIVTDLQGVTDNGNVTTNVVQFSNATTGLVTTANIEVGGDLKIDGLTAGKVPYVAADKFLKDSFITTTGDATVISSNLDVTGNIFMRGNKFIVESETKLINDAIIGIANNNTSSTTDKGIIMQNTTGNVAIIHHGAGDGFADQLTFGYTADPLDTVTVTNDLTKELTVNVLGNVITQNNLSVGGTLKINNITAAAQHSLQAVTNVGNVTSNTVQFSNAITSLVASSNIVATGNVSAGYNTNTTSYFGRAAVGYMGQNNQASFAHVSHNTASSYALKQTATGPTYINTPASGHIRFTVNDGNSGAEKMRITSAGKVGIGASVPDATLHVVGNAYVSSNLTVSGNVEVGTADLFVDTVNSRVGIGLTDPEVKLHVKGGPICVERTYPDGQQAGIVFMEDHTNNDCMFIAYDAGGTAEPNADEHLCFYSKNGGGPDPSATDGLLMMKMRSDGHIQIGDAEYKQNHTYLTIASDGGNTWEQGIRFIHHGMDNSNMYGWRIRGSDITDSFHINRIDAGNQQRDAFTLDASGMLILDQGNRPGASSNTHGIRMKNTDNGDYWNLFISDNNHFRFAYNGGARGYVDQNDPNNQMNFTGQHRTFIKDAPFTEAVNLEGLIVSADQNKYIKMSGGIEAGSNAITMNETLPVVSVSVTAKDKKCFGVISASEDPETRTEQYGVFGSTFEKEKGDTRVYINSVGEGAIWVTNINGPLESGDYITTSNVAGYGQKQDSEFLANYTVAKITMDCDFDPVTQPVQVIKKDEDGENILDEHSQIQWEDDPSGATEKAYKIRYLDADGNITDEASAVHKAAFVGCTYHCG